MKHQGPRAVLAAVIFVMAAAGAPRAQQPSVPPTVPFLDVPYIPQTEALCGGAAAAMVMRYWGATGIQAETFAPLVDAAAGGIHGAALLKDLQIRGWEARSFAGDGPLIRARLADRQPVVALIEDRPGAFHYVVIVAWTNNRVVIHDPARAPFRVLDEAAFDRAWQKSDRWTLVVLPGTAARNVVLPPLDDPVPAKSPCEGLVAEAVRAVERGDESGALAALGTAAALCPLDSAPPREMAGVFALRGDWKEAARHAQDAVRRNPRDAHAWRTLATSRFLHDDPDAALTAWNRIGEPVIDIVNVRGLDDTRYLAATRSMRLDPGDVLSQRDLVAAGRRLADLPAAQTSRVTYRPLENGRAAVDAVIIERPRFPVAPLSLTTAAVRALSDREATTAVANPTGAGDLMSASWRWWTHRSRVAATYSTPAPFGGVASVDLFRDEQTYSSQAGSAGIREVRRGGALRFSDWSPNGFRWTAGVGIDSWLSLGRTVAVTASIDRRLLNDLVSVQLSGAGLAGGFGAWTLNTSATWRSDARHEGIVWLARVEGEHAGGDAPLALWPGAGTGHARNALLRAHPLLDDGIVTGDVFGRRLYSTSIEMRRWVRPLWRVVRVAPAVFIDVARADQRLERGIAWHADAGAGVRIAVPGSGVVRLDVAKGLRDGATAWSIGWTR